MALDGKKLGTEIKAAIIHPDAPPEIQAKVESLWQKIGDVIVNHFVTNGEIPPGINVQAGQYSGSTVGPGKIK